MYVSCKVSPLVLTWKHNFDLRDVGFDFQNLYKKQDFDLQDVRFDLQNLCGNTISTSKMWISTFGQRQFCRHLLQKTWISTSDTRLAFIILNWRSKVEFWVGVDVFHRRCRKIGLWLKVEIHIFEIEIVFPYECWRSKRTSCKSKSCFLYKFCKPKPKSGRGVARESTWGWQG